jgi:hypothetical protein
MEQHTIKKGTVYNRNPGIDDETVDVEFTGEKLGSRSTGDTRGTTKTLYKTEDGDFILHVKNWSNWQGENTKHDILRETKEGLRKDHPKLAQEVGVIDALSLDEVL